MPSLTVRLLGPLFPAALAAVGLCLVPVAARAAGGPGPRKVVVLPLSGLGVDEDVASSLLGFLRAEVARLPGFTLVDPVRHGRIPGADCRGEERCLASAGRTLGADDVVAGTVAGVGEAYSIDLKRIIVRTGREDARITEVISGEREVLIDGVRGAAFKLLLPSQYVGTVQVELAEEGAEVFIDGRPVGRTPLAAPITNLLPGKHALKIVKAGFADFDKWIEVFFSRLTVVKVDLRNSVITGVMFEKQKESAAPAPEAALAATTPAAPQPMPVEPPGFLTGQRVGAIVAAALGLGLGGGGLYFALQARREADLARDLQVEPGMGVWPAKADEARGILRAQKANAIAADVLWAAGGAALAAGVVLFVTGGASTGSSPAPTPAPTPTLSLAPGGAVVGIAGSF